MGDETEADTSALVSNHAANKIETLYTTHIICPRRRETKRKETQGAPSFERTTRRLFIATRSRSRESSPGVRVRCVGSHRQGGRNAIDHRYTPPEKTGNEKKTKPKSPAFQCRRKQGMELHTSRRPLFLLFLVFDWSFFDWWFVDW